MFGLMVGAGLGAILTATTGDAIYVAITGIGLALGLSLGAAYDASKEEEENPNGERA